MNEELNVQNAELEDTTPQENQEQPQDNSEENTPDTTPEGQEGTEEESARSGNDGSNIAAEPEPEAFLPVRYNHSDINLTREEAKNWAQKGMFYFDKLDFVAAQSDQTVEELLETLLTSIDENKRRELKEQFGDDEGVINDLMDVFHTKQKEKYEKAVSDRRNAEEEKNVSQTARLAEEFNAMQADFPELKSVDDIPASVLKEAQNKPLAYAYLLHKHKENQKIALSEENKSKAEKSSTGSMKSAESDITDTATASLLSGIWGK